MKNVKKVSVSEMVSILTNPKAVAGCNFIGFDALTTTTLTGGKSNPHKGRAQKQLENNLAMIMSNKNGSAYGAMVNRRKVAQGLEPNFEAGKLPWGVRVNGTAVIENKGKYYLQTIYSQGAVSLLDKADEMGIDLTNADNELIELMKEKVVGFESCNGTTKHLLDGVEVDKSEIIGLKKSTPNGKQGGLDEKMKVIVRTFKIESFTRLTMNGTTYIIED